MDPRRRRELRELNSRVWAGEQDVFQVAGSLDSSLKKNTAFIKRLRTAITAASLSTFLQEIRTLSLHKYLSEIISALYEGLSKVKSADDIAAAVEIVSALHQRFGPAEFTGYLAWLIGRGLSTPERAQLKSLGPEAREKEERERLTRQRVLLKVATDLWLAAVVRSLDDAVRPEEAARGKENVAAANGKAAEGPAKAKSGANASRPAAAAAGSEPLPLEVLKDLLGHDRDHVNLPLVVLFVKSYGWLVLGLRPRTAKETTTAAAVDDGAGADAAPSDADDSSGGGGTGSGAGSGADDHDQGREAALTEPELQQRFRNVLARYFDDVKEHLVRDQDQLAAQARRNAEAYVKSGEIFEDRQASFEKQTKAYERRLANAQFLADALGLDLPDPRARTRDDGAAASDPAAIGLVKTSDYLGGDGDGAGIWEDEEERRFYENLVDLKDRVPAVLLDDGRKKRADGDEAAGKKADEAADATAAATTTTADSTTDSTAPAAPLPDPSAEEQSTAPANRGVGGQVDALLARLPELGSKEQVDQAAVDFCFLNSKASRNRLIKAVQTLPKARSDLAPLYGRLVATLARYMADVAAAVVAAVEAEFRSLQRRRDKDFLGRVRTGNVRYLAELTKFGVVPEHVIFHCLRLGLDDFSRLNIELICQLLESCGRYLLRQPATGPRAAAFLDTLRRKKAGQALGPHERMLIENAVYLVDPPPRPARPARERSPVALFVRRLIYVDLNKRSYSKVLKQIRKLHWEEAEVVQLLGKIFAKPGKVKHSNIHLLAVLLGALYRSHADFVVAVIDDLLEHVTVGLEQNDFRDNQRRVAEVKYLGELYNYKMVDSAVIFDTLYRLLTFGHEGGTPRPGRPCPLDLPDDFFRIRLVCTLLDTCGVCFDRGQAKKKLDFFLTFFQYYIMTKEALPMEVEFLVHDSYSLTRPQWSLATTLDEAARVFGEAVAQNYQVQETGRPAEADGSDDEASSDEMNDDDAVAGQAADEAGSSGEEIEAGAEEVGDGEVEGEVEADSDEDSDSDGQDGDSDEEQIVVRRREAERDPEAEADFDREFAKVLSESLESRKLERKPLFDVPLPMRRAARDGPAPAEATTTTTTATTATTTATATEAGPNGGPSDKMAFSLLTKRGNRAQTRTVELPSDSTFALAMKSQQQAERLEQQRIKNLVLNYDLQDDEPEGLDRLGPSSARSDKAGATRSKQRARKLQLSDVDWT